jgi:hypothetical protein
MMFSGVGKRGAGLFFCNVSVQSPPSSLFQREASYLKQEFPLFKRGTESDLIVSFWSFGHWRLENYLRFGLALAVLEFTLQLDLDDRLLL